jgi:hypothetical protein
MRRRRADVGRGEDDLLSWLGRYGDLEFRAAAEAAVACHGAAVLPAVPLRFWGQDVAAAELAAPLLAPLLGRPFTSAETRVVTWALLDLPGFLRTLNPRDLAAAIDRSLSS